MSLCDDAAVMYEMYASSSSVFPVGTSNHPRAMFALKHSIERMRYGSGTGEACYQNSEISENS